MSLFLLLLLNRLRGLGSCSAVLLSAMAFALWRTNFYQTWVAFMAGIVYACVTLRTGSIRESIFLHMFSNGLSAFYDIINENINPRVSYASMQFIEASCWCFYLLAIVVTVVLVIFALRRVRKERREQRKASLSLCRSIQSENLQACLRSVWFWSLLVGGLTISIVDIFA